MSKSNNAAILSALAFAQSSYVSFSQEHETGTILSVTAGNLVQKTKKAKAENDTRGKNQPIPQAIEATAAAMPNVPKVNLPLAGTIQAPAFYKAIQQAGKRFVDGRGIVVDDIAKRADERLAIAGFCGYVLSEPHGSQLDSATRQARREMQPVTPKEYKRGAPSVIGVTGNNVVSGLPDNLGKVYDNLVGREKMTAEEMIEHIKKASQLPKGEVSQVHAAGLAALEKARLNQIQRDLRAL